MCSLLKGNKGSGIREENENKNHSFNSGGGINSSWSDCGLSIFMKTLEQRVKDIEQHLGFDQECDWKITIDDGLTSYKYVYHVPNGGNLSIDKVSRLIGQALDPDIIVFPQGKYVCSS